jgi:hypothetical protein
VQIPKYTDRGIDIFPMIQKSVKVLIIMIIMSATESKPVL